MGDRQTARRRGINWTRKPRRGDSGARRCRQEELRGAEASLGREEPWRADEEAAAWAGRVPGDGKPCRPGQEGADQTEGYKEIGRMGGLTATEVSGGERAAVEGDYINDSQVQKLFG
ncbi:hypothetical protein KSP39_PZI007883 [Platanthera zijinensis]|uniref:Uncharacterized protein n=1 Tax=Platanthera zijinensis TaxID=2320716 RepID=A0AAP0BNQ5_9ASPA